MTSELELYDSDTKQLSLVDDEMAAEFKVATRQAVEDNVDDFEFYGYSIETITAVEVVKKIDEHRTYH